SHGRASERRPDPDDAGCRPLVGDRSGARAAGAAAWRARRRAAARGRLRRCPHSRTDRGRGAARPHLPGIRLMNFSLTPEQESIRDSIERICRDFDDAYWLRKDREGGFPFDFFDAMAENGWLGI